MRNALGCYEVIDGELYVTPAPSLIHQRAVLKLALLLAPYVDERGVGEVIISPADVMFGPRNMVEPDLFVVPLVEGVPPHAWEDVGRLLLAVEVLSPSTLRTDRGKKRELYQRKGVPEYWIVDVQNRSVDRWRPNDSSPETVAETLEWQPDRFTEPLAIDLPDYFARVLGEPRR
jgi:Uma2 family endonuclease